MDTFTALTTVEKDVAKLVEAEVSATGGLLRLAPCWVPRSFLQPGMRLKLHPDDLYAYGLNRGGIDERWFASTTPAANEDRTPDEGLSYVVVGKQRFTLQQAVAECGAHSSARPSGRNTASGRFIRSSSTTWDRSRITCTRMPSRPLVGQEGKPESYYFPPQHNNVGNNFPYTFMGFEPGTTKAQVRKCLENWNKGDNGILDLSKAYRLKVGTGWLIDPCILHAPGSLCTYEPQWGSDVFGMYQNLVEGRLVPWSLLVKDMPKSSTRTSTSSWTSSTGTRTWIRNSRTTTTSNPCPSPTPEAKATWTAGSSMARWTANSSSPPRNSPSNPA